MGRQQDLRDVDAVARQFNMSDEARFEFGDFLESCKVSGDRGTKNDRGDFTWDELRRKAREFLDLHDEE